MAGNKKTISYRYDSVRNRVGMTDSDGGRFTYAYDSVNRMTHMVNPQGERTTYAYDPAGRRTVKKLANGTRTSFTYDAAGNLTRLANLKSDGTTISSFDYDYDKVGNRTAVQEADGSRVTWSYDATYQLTGEHRTGSTPYRDTYTYDASGNRLLKIHDGARTTSAYDAANQLIYSEDASGRTTYTFDADGNQQVVEDPAGDRTTYAWDYENRMTSAQLPSGVRNTMAYEPDGLRVKLEESTGTKKFVWDRRNYLAETDENNDTQVVYTNEPRYYGKLVSQRRGSESRWYHFDAIGSTRELTDAAEVVTATRLYDAWGVPLASSGSTVFPFAFVGQLGYYDDAESLLRYVRARLVAASTGRWTSSDPLKAIRTYTYADNQPTVLIDPSGLVCVDDNPEACCCCVEGMSLRDVIEITRQDREQGLDYFGHRFIVHTSLSWVIDPSIPPRGGDCTFEWYECASSVPPSLRDLGAKPVEWYDAFDIARGRSDTGAQWDAYFDREPPYDGLKCPDNFEVEAIDPPQVAVGQSRILKFAIKATSAPDCPCALKDLTIFATQTLATQPKIVDFRRGLRAKVPSGQDIDCGDPPFRQRPSPPGFRFE